MSELVNIIVTKTGIPAATAQTVVNTIVDYLKSKLPFPVVAQIDDLLSKGLPKIFTYLDFALCKGFGKTLLRGCSKRRYSPFRDSNWDSMVVLDISIENDILSGREY